MITSRDNKRAAIRFWEIRRAIYNLILIPPALLGYSVASTLIYVGEPHGINLAFAISHFVLAAFAANFCYSFAYALEFFFAGETKESRWFSHGRSIVFILGLLLSILFAFIGGRNIAEKEFHTLNMRVMGR